MKFSAEEICKIGIEVERNGREYYQYARDRVGDSQLKDLFQKLAEAETIHERTYKMILTKLEKNTAAPAVEFDQDYEIYLKALASSRVFTTDMSVEKVLATISTPRDLIRTAMGFEKDAILWLQEMKKWVSDDDAPILEEFISYEKEHLSELSAVLDYLAG